MLYRRYYSIHGVDCGRDILEKVMDVWKVQFYYILLIKSFKDFCSHNEGKRNFFFLISHETLFSFDTSATAKFAINAKCE